MTAAKKLFTFDHVNIYKKCLGFLNTYTLEIQQFGEGLEATIAWSPVKDI